MNYYSSVPTRETLNQPLPPVFWPTSTFLCEAELLMIPLISFIYYHFFRFNNFEHFIIFD